MNAVDRHFTLKLAETPGELLAAQRLRYRVFVTELGASGPTVDHQRQTESDQFDSIYDHLLLIDRKRDPARLDHVVGVYRLLRGEVAAAGPGFYSAAEYDLDPILKSGRNLLELGRSCVDNDVRGGVGVYLLWNALADFVQQYGIDVMFGVASYHGTDVAPIAQSLSYLHHNHLAPPESRVRARLYQPLDLIAPEKIDADLALAQTPSLIKAYLRLGGVIGDGGYIDRDFNTTDVCLLMDTARMSKRHKQAYSRRVAGREK